MRTYRLMSDIFLYSTCDLPIVHTRRTIAARVNRDGLQDVPTVPKSIQQIFRVRGSTNFGYFAWQYPTKRSNYIR